MEYIESIVGLIALVIAIWALNLQRSEIIKNGKINSLIYTASMLQQRIDYHSRIINDMKGEGKQYDEWSGHALKINNELRPLLKKVNTEFLDIASKYDGILHENEIRSALKLNQNNS